MSKPALGRGLSALLGAKPPGGPTLPTSERQVPAAPPQVSSGEPTPGGVQRVSVDKVRPSSLQPRRDFPPERLQELADSIRQQGILQPLIVRRQGESFELIAGERRWRAAQLVGLTEVPIVVREADDPTVLEWMLVENLQREDLNPMDEAQGYAELMARFHLTQESVSLKVGRSRTAVANALRLLNLPAGVQTWVRERKLSTGHAKVILGLPTPDLQTSTAEKVLSGGLSVRQTEEWVSRLSAAANAAPQTPAQAVPNPPAVRDPHVVAVEDKLRQRLGTRVGLRYRQGRGQIDIRFSSDDELERLLDLLGVQME